MEHRVQFLLWLDSDFEFQGQCPDLYVELHLGDGVFRLDHMISRQASSKSCSRFSIGYSVGMHLIHEVSSDQ